VAIYLAAAGILKPFAELYSKNDQSGWRTQHLLWFGSTFVVLTPFLYMLARDVMDIYVIQLLYGIGIAFCEPAWSRMMDKTYTNDTKPSLDKYSPTSTLMAAGLALVGGFIADQRGVTTLLLYLDAIALSAAILLILLYWRFGLTPQKHRV
jgi:hypothetical protein